MTSERIKFFEETLSFTVHTANGEAFSFHLEVKKLFQLATLISALILTLFFGTLLFFKERQRNEDLVQQLLPSRITTNPVSAPTEKTPEVIPQVTVSKPKLTEFSGLCNDSICTASFVLMSQDAKPAEGSLVIVLETQVPQIGSGNPTATVRKKFYAYPEQALSEIPETKKLSELKSKSFEVARSLTSKTEFKIGAFQTPLALHAYLFSKDKELLREDTISLEEASKNDP